MSSLRAPPADDGNHAQYGDDVEEQSLLDKEEQRRVATSLEARGVVDGMGERARLPA